MIPTPVTLVLIIVSKKDTLNRLSSYFGVFSWSEKNIAHTPKQTKIVVVKRMIGETLHMNTTVQGSRKLDVNKLGGCRNNLSPKVGRKRAAIIIARAVSRRWRCLRSATPF